jgi:predicted NAD/FAD-dependent oxidoreductase
LRSYARRRNNAADHGGVSRLSAYFHYGMISPMRIAREAAEHAAEKFLDELLIWRELAFHFCRHMGEKVDSLDGVPEWARATLSQHAADRRTDHHSWETLARGITGDPLWDACQQSLLKHGELHNNVRMTWGKAFLKWTQSPERALQLAIDLNHRYALDGRDPSSYGGLLWCFGQFDRPFEPEQPVLGTVRTRDLEEHTKRIDLAKFQNVVRRPITGRPPKVAIVGAGLGGLMAARTLADHGLQVRLFDKSRGVGGRLATRRTTEGLRFDHGAQYFTARDCRFLRYVRSWVDDGVVAPFSGRIVHLRDGVVLSEKSDTARYVARPTMNILAKHIADQLDERIGATRWRLIDAQQESLGEFDKVIFNCPPPQAGPLLAGHSDLSQRIAAVTMNPCWSVMFHRADRAEAIDFDGAFVDANPLSWICRDSCKPGRQVDHGECWVLHASAQWSNEHLEDDPAEVTEALTAAFAQATGQAVGKLEYVTAHRWRYAIPVNPIEASCLWDSSEGVGACGDWCGGPRVEGAFLSGMAIAGHVLREITIDRSPFRSGEELFVDL